MKQKKVTLIFEIATEPAGSVVEETVSELFPDHNPDWDTDRIKWRQAVIEEYRQKYGDRLTGWRGELSTVDVPD